MTQWIDAEFTSKDFRPVRTLDLPVQIVMPHFAEPNHVVSPPVKRHLTLSSHVILFFGKQLDAVIKFMLRNRQDFTVIIECARDRMVSN